MKKIIIFFTIALFGFPNYAQVGINNTDPKASLDITATNQANPSNTDGLLIPRIDNFPTTPPSVDQQGMLVYLTTTSGSNASGYYYWDNGSTTWKAMLGTSDADWFEAGTSSPPNSINDNIYTRGKVGIGTNDPSAGIELIYTNDNGTNSYNENAMTIDYTNIRNTGIGIGLSINAKSTGNANVTAAYFRVADSNNSSVSSAVKALNVASSSFNFGLSANAIGAGTRNIGVISSASGATDYNIGGSFDAIQGISMYRYGIVAQAYGGSISNWAGYFGNFLAATPGSGNVYIHDLLQVEGPLKFSNGANNNYILKTDASGNATWVDPNTVFTDTQNTLDQAYDEGGAGAGRTITADNGAVRIAGTDGFQVTGTYNSGATIGSPGAGTRMVFNPRKRAFRAGGVSGTQWDNANVGVHSFASGYNTTASGYTSTAIGNYSTASGASSTAMGFNTTASGATSTAMGFYTTAPSYAETTIGIFPTIYTPVNTTDFASTDRLFTIGNGINSLNNSNALTIYKSGLMNINDEYNMPLTDGSANQVMATDGAGQLGFVNPSAIFTDTNTQNTLDQAYDQGGAGAGKTITADNGAISIEGTDGFQITGTSGTGAAISLSGAGTRMFFNPRKAAFRAGSVNGTQWDNANVGNNSFAVGLNNIASGSNSVALGGYSTSSGATSVVIGSYATASGNYSISNGYGTNASGTSSIALGVYSDATASSSIAIGANSTASGNKSIAVGNYIRAYSFSEIAFGIYPTTYMPSSTTTFDNSDRLFVVGNGADETSRSNALTIYKNGLMNINDAYNMPLTDGAANQVLQTDGTGNLSWIAPSESDADWFESGNTPPNSINDNIFTNGKVGINNPSPSSSLDIIANSSGTIGQLCITENQANDGSRILFKNSAETTNKWTLYTRADNTSSYNYFNIHNTISGDILTIKGDGRVGINDNNPTYALELPNNSTTSIGKARANAWVTYSDTRIKKEQQQIKYGLSDLLKIQPKSYIQFASEFKNDELVLTPNSGKEEIGFIAQELYNIIPEATYKPEDENKNLWSVNYEKIIPVTVQAIKELNTKLENLETENQQLIQQLKKYEDLEARLSALENNSSIPVND